MTVFERLTDATRDRRRTAGFAPATHLSDALNPHIFGYSRFILTYKWKS